MPFYCAREKIGNMKVIPEIAFPIICFISQICLSLDTEQCGSAVSSADAANGVQLTSEKQTSAVSSADAANGVQLTSEKQRSAVSSADAANGVQLTSEKQTSVVNVYSISNQLVIITCDNPNGK
jgi:hypothetical protein